MPIDIFEHSLRVKHTQVKESLFDTLERTRIAIQKKTPSGIDSIEELKMADFEINKVIAFIQQIP